MKADGSDWRERYHEKSESEELFDNLLFNRQLAGLFTERQRITKELERLLPEDHTQFVEYLLNTINLYEKECEAVLNVDEDDPVPEEYKDVFYDKNTTLVQHLYAKRMFILGYLQEIKALYDKKHFEEIAKELNEEHGKNVNQIFIAKTKIEDGFKKIETLTLETIKDSSDNTKNESIKKSLEEMRKDLRNEGFNV